MFNVSESSQASVPLLIMDDHQTHKEETPNSATPALAMNSQGVCRHAYSIPESLHAPRRTIWVEFDPNVRLNIKFRPLAIADPLSFRDARNDSSSNGPLHLSDGFLVIRPPPQDSPVYNKIFVGDILTKVNDTDFIGMECSKATAKFKAFLHSSPKKGKAIPEKTERKITVRRPTDATWCADVLRAAGIPISTNTYVVGMDRLSTREKEEADKASFIDAFQQVMGSETFGDCYQSTFGMTQSSISVNANNSISQWRKDTKLVPPPAIQTPAGMPCSPQSASTEKSSNIPMPPPAGHHPALNSDLRDPLRNASNMSAEKKPNGFTERRAPDCAPKFPSTGNRENILDVPTPGASKASDGRLRPRTQVQQRTNQTSNTDFINYNSALPLQQNSPTAPAAAVTNPNNVDPPVPMLPRMMPPNVRVHSQGHPLLTAFNNNRRLPLASTEHDRDVLPSKLHWLVLKHAELHSCGEMPTIIPIAPGKDIGLQLMRVRCSLCLANVSVSPPLDQSGEMVISSKAGLAVSLLCASAGKFTFHLLNGCPAVTKQFYDSLKAAKEEATIKTSQTMLLHEYFEKYAKDRSLIEWKKEICLRLIWDNKEIRNDNKMLPINNSAAPGGDRGPSNSDGFARGGTQRSNSDRGHFTQKGSNQGAPSSGNEDSIEVELNTSQKLTGDACKVQLSLSATKVVPSKTKAPKILEGNSQIYSHSYKISGVCQKSPVHRDRCFGDSTPSDQQKAELPDLICLQSIEADRSAETDIAECSALDLRSTIKTSNSSSTGRDRQKPTMSAELKILELVPDEKRLVTDEDKCLVTDFVFALMNQVKFCHTENFHKAGMECVHCRGGGQPYRLFPSSVIAISSMLRPLRNHLMKGCKFIHPDFSAALRKLEVLHSTQYSCRSMSDSSKFCGNVWRNLYSKLSAASKTGFSRNLSTKKNSQIIDIPVSPCVQSSLNASKDVARTCHNGTTNPQKATFLKLSNSSRKDSHIQSSIQDSGSLKKIGQSELENPNTLQDNYDAQNRSRKGALPLCSSGSSKELCSEMENTLATETSDQVTDFSLHSAEIYAPGAVYHYDKEPASTKLQNGDRSIGDSSLKDHVDQAIQDPTYFIMRRDMPKYQISSAEGNIGKSFVAPADHKQTYKNTTNNIVSSKIHQPAKMPEQTGYLPFELTDKGDSMPIDKQHQSKTSSDRSCDIDEEIGHVYRDNLKPQPQIDRQAGLSETNIIYVASNKNAINEKIMPSESYFQESRLSEARSARRDESHRSTGETPSARDSIDQKVDLEVSINGSHANCSRIEINNICVNKSRVYERKRDSSGKRGDILRVEGSAKHARPDDMHLPALPKVKKPLSAVREKMGHKARADDSSCVGDDETTTLLHNKDSSGTSGANISAVRVIYLDDSKKAIDNCSRGTLSPGNLSASGVPDNMTDDRNVGKNTREADSQVSQNQHITTVRKRQCSDELDCHNVQRLEIQKGITSDDSCFNRKSKVGQDKTIGSHSATRTLCNDSLENVRRHATAIELDNCSAHRGGSDHWVIEENNIEKGEHDKKKYIAHKLSFQGVKIKNPSYDTAITLSTRFPNKRSENDTSRYGIGKSDGDQDDTHLFTKNPSPEVSFAGENLKGAHILTSSIEPTKRIAPALRNTSSDEVVTRSSSVETNPVDDDDPINSLNVGSKDDDRKLTSSAVSTSQIQAKQVVKLRATENSAVNSQFVKLLPFNEEKADITFLRKQVVHPVRNPCPSVLPCNEGNQNRERRNVEDKNSATSPPQNDGDFQVSKNSDPISEVNVTSTVQAQVMPRSLHLSKCKYLRSDDNVSYQKLPPQRSQSSDKITSESHLVNQSILCPETFVESICNEGELIPGFQKTIIIECEVERSFSQSISSSERGELETIPSESHNLTSSRDDNRPISPTPLDKCGNLIREEIEGRTKRLVDSGISGPETTISVKSKQIAQRESEDDLSESSILESGEPRTLISEQETIAECEEDDFVSESSIPDGGKLRTAIKEITGRAAEFEVRSTTCTTEELDDKAASLESSAQNEASPCLSAGDACQSPALDGDEKKVLASEEPDVKTNCEASNIICKFPSSECCKPYALNVRNNRALRCEVKESISCTVQTRGRLEVPTIKGHKVTDTCEPNGSLLLTTAQESNKIETPGDGQPTNVPTKDGNSSKKPPPQSLRPVNSTNEETKATTKFDANDVALEMPPQDCKNSETLRGQASKAVTKSIAFENISETSMPEFDRPANLTDEQTKGVTEFKANGDSSETPLPQCDRPKTSVVQETEIAAKNIAIKIISETPIPERDRPANLVTECKGNSANATDEGTKASTKRDASDLTLEMPPPECKKPKTLTNQVSKSATKTSANENISETLPLQFRGSVNSTNDETRADTKSDANGITFEMPPQGCKASKKSKTVTNQVSKAATKSTNIKIISKKSMPEFNKTAADIREAQISSGPTTDIEIGESPLSGAYGGGSSICGGPQVIVESDAERRNLHLSQLVANHSSETVAEIGTRGEIIPCVAKNALSYNVVSLGDKPKALSDQASGTLSGSQNRDNYYQIFGPETNVPKSSAIDKTEVIVGWRVKDTSSHDDSLECQRHDKIVEKEMVTNMSMSPPCIRKTPSLDCGEVSMLRSATCDDVVGSSKKDHNPGKLLCKESGVISRHTVKLNISAPSLHNGDGSQLFVDETSKSTSRHNDNHSSPLQTNALRISLRGESGKTATSTSDKKVSASSSPKEKISTSPARSRLKTSEMDRIIGKTKSIMNIAADEAKVKEASNIEFHEEPSPTGFQKSIVRTTDKKLVTDYIYFMMSQLSFCRASDGTGRCGFQCLHCDHFQIFPTAARRLSSHVRQIRDHFLRDCIPFPSDLKQQLKELEETKSSQYIHLPSSGQSEFFDLIWKRIKCADEAHQFSELKKNEITSQSGMTSGSELHADLTVSAHSSRNDTNSHAVALNLQNKTVSIRPSTVQHGSNFAHKTENLASRRSKHVKVVLPSDRKLITEFTFLLMSQVRFCHSTDGTSCGFECIHCNGDFRVFPGSGRRLASNAKQIHEHLVRDCSSFPCKIASKLAEFEKHQSSQYAYLPSSGQSDFFNNLWKRRQTYFDATHGSTPIETLPSSKSFVRNSFVPTRQEEKCLNKMESLAAGVAPPTEKKADSRSLSRTSLNSCVATRAKCSSKRKVASSARRHIDEEPQEKRSMFAKPSTENSIKGANGKTSCQGWDAVFPSELEKKNLQLVVSGDRDLVTDYVLMLIRQLKVCRLPNKSTQCGLGCRHCEELLLHPSSSRKLKNMLRPLHDHLMNCKTFPQSSKLQLSDLEYQQSMQYARLPSTGLSKFFELVWSRLQSHKEN